MSVLALGCLARVAGAQVILEWQGQGMATVTAAEFVGAGPGVGIRTPGRLRFGVGVSVGVRDGAAAARGEAMASFHLDPFTRRGVTPYVGGGFAVAATGNDVAEYLLVLLGVESNPGGRVGWFIDGGVGGGVRLSAGVRLRRWARTR